MIYFHKIFLFVAIVLITASFSIATEPSLPPYHEYIVNGKLDRLNNQEENFVVTLVGKFNQRYPLDTLIDLNGEGFSSLTWKAVTDSAGYFIIDVKHSTKADSIGIKISSPDRLPFISPLFYSGTATNSITKQFHEGQQSGCRSCPMSTDANLKINIVGYQYIYLFKHVSLPY